MRENIKAFGDMTAVYKQGRPMWQTTSTLVSENIREMVFSEINPDRKRYVFSKAKTLNL